MMEITFDKPSKIATMGRSGQGDPFKCSLCLGDAYTSRNAVIKKDIMQMEQCASEVQDRARLKMPEDTSAPR